MGDPATAAPKARKVFQNPKKRHEEVVNTYRAARTMKICGEKRYPGQLVPEAHMWLRVGNITHTGYLQEVRVPEAEFDKAVQDYCPDLADRLAEKAKGVPVAKKDDTKFTGYVFNEDGQVEDVAARRRLERERELANIAPNDRPASLDNAGTPAHLEENTPDHVHSDGGPTVWTEDQAELVGDLLDPKAESISSKAEREHDEKARRTDENAMTEKTKENKDSKAAGKDR